VLNKYPCSSKSYKQSGCRTPPNSEFTLHYTGWTFLLRLWKLNTGGSCKSRKTGILASPPQEVPLSPLSLPRACLRAHVAARTGARQRGKGRRRPQSCVGIASKRLRSITLEEFPICI